MAAGVASVGLTIMMPAQPSTASRTTQLSLGCVCRDAYCPPNRVSNHRYHHLHTDTPLDLHSPYEGFWWSHMGWLVDTKVCVCADLLPRPTGLETQPAKTTVHPAFVA